MVNLIASLLDFHLIEFKEKYTYFISDKLIVHLVFQYTDFLFKLSFKGRIIKYSRRERITMASKAIYYYNN